VVDSFFLVLAMLLFATKVMLAIGLLAAQEQQVFFPQRAAESVPALLQLVWELQEQECQRQSRSIPALELAGQP
jgi:hypothetical protein